MPRTYVFLTRFSLSVFKIEQMPIWLAILLGLISGIATFLVVLFLVTPYLRNKILSRYLKVLYTDDFLFVVISPPLVLIFVLLLMLP